MSVLPIYLDHTATARPWPDVIACLSSQLELQYANPASLHRLGQSAAASLRQSRQQIAAALGCSENELILTSGGSESINFAIKGAAAANPRLPKRIIISDGEHAAVTESAAYLRQLGWQTEILPLLPNGQADLLALEQALREPAALISLIHVSNETGAVNPVDSIVSLRNRLQPAAIIHLDAVQSLGRQPVNFRSTGVDLLSGSGHKVGAPKGIGWLLVRQGIRLTPLIHGGGQQGGLRSGTENPPLAAALAFAINVALQDQAGKEQQVRQLRRLLLDELQNRGQPYQVLSPDDGVPQILCIAFPGLRGETLMQALAAREICVSTGAACSARRQKKNRILQSMGIPVNLAESSIRISLAAVNTEDEIRITAQAIHEIHRQLARLPKIAAKPAR
ncbi:MAG TPA: cysteine desulfurase NifS [Clostridiales bacterium]|nr:cysteine desulfurase NifS [Clostridiales bacterium]